MTNGLIEGLQKTLAQVREREEMCNDVALSIQRLLDAEGAPYVVLTGLKEVIYEQMVGRMKRQPDPAVKAPVVKATVKAKAKAATAKAPTLEKRTCETCGEEYQPMRKDNRFCSPACGNAGKKLYKKEPVAAPKQAAPVRVVQDMPTVSTDRLAAIRAAARRMDGLPEED